MSPAKIAAVIHVFGLTGGIGSGKSTVAGHWRRRGLAVVDADELARQVVLPGQPALAAIAADFGTAILLPNGQLDRQALGRLVFQNAQARQRLNRLMHPAVRSLAQAAFDQLAAEGAALACYEVPLLFETGQQDSYRPVVVVSVTEKLQLTRTQQRDQSSSDAALARVRSQMPLAEKVALADYIIDNSGTEAETCAQADQVLQAIRSELGLTAAGSGEP